MKLTPPLYTIDGFACVDDPGDLHDFDLSAPDLAARIDANFGCAIFDLTKR